MNFSLFHTDENGLPTTLTHEQAGYFDLSPLDLGENARRDMVLTLEDMGFVIEASHHEKAPAQHEIDFQYDEALATADNIMTFKLAVKTIAKRHGLHATFMPKPKYGDEWLRYAYQYVTVPMMAKTFLPIQRIRWDSARRHIILSVV